ncbi:hypothetical protein FB45DRAFT_262834 [Roridomyces roridus]|uniref:non-specific serine/threonine protein kinase n=1 Tax=Roridomyces roridus TaxID=1738132 RepID=A0AAD7FDS6_9AGAR|nr:hypothetical protein FB45DRAFT_262834 [Roridomyces roridus]
MKGAESIQVLESAKKTCDETLRKCLQVVEVRSTCEDDGGDSKDTDGIIRSVGVGPRHAPSLRRSAGRRGRSQAAYDPKALFAFHPSNASLFDIHAVGNQIISTSLDAFLGDPSSCHRLVSKLRDLGRSCQTGSIPQHWFSEILASVAAFSRTLKWYQAVRDSEEGDHTGWNFFVSWQESSPEHAPNSPESIKDFPIVSTLSRRVFIAQRTSTPDTFVVKVVPKRVMFSKNKITLIRDKRMAIYNRTDSYFVNKIYFTFQSKSNVYLVKELHRQGNCVALIRNSLGRVGEVAARNFVVQLVDGLEHLHDAGIIHRCAQVATTDGH